MPRCFTCLFAVAAIAGLPAASAHAVTVYAASSLSSALPSMSGKHRYSFAGSNVLKAQIERGAPADVFAAASRAEPLALYRAGLCARPVTFATNRLVIVTPRANPGGITSAFSLMRGGFKISVGNAGVPVGVYTRQLLTRMRILEILDPKAVSNTVSQESNVSQVLAKVTLGSADAGFVYRTDALGVADRVKQIALPISSQPVVRYDACAVRRPGADTKGAQAFIARLTGSHGRNALKRFGFGLPKPKAKPNHRS